jgi:uncharacterized membrane protein YhaH (DUF805 family)
MSFTTAVADGFRTYGDFQGRATRSAFWWWILFTLLATAALSAIPYSTPTPSVLGTSGSPLVTVWELVVLLPTLAVLVRRLRDAGRGWGHAFWLLLPVAGVVIVGVMALQPSVREPLPEMEALSTTPLGSR